MLQVVKSALLAPRRVAERVKSEIALVPKSYPHMWRVSHRCGADATIDEECRPHVAGWMRLLGVPSGLAGTGLRSRVPCPAHAAWVARVLRSRRRRNERCAKHASQNEGQLKIQHYLRETCQTGREHQAASTGIYRPRSGWTVRRTPLDAHLGRKVDETTGAVQAPLS